MAQAGYTPIQLYLSTTASAVPSAGNLANGELAINITDGKLFYKDNGGVVQVLATKGAGTIGGSNTQVQYNSSGALAGSSNLTFDGTTLTMGANPVLSGGVANGVAYLNGSKVLTTGSALQFDGTNLGFGVTPSAWATAKALQIGYRASLFSYNNVTTDVGNNAYFNGSDYKYIETALASFYRQSTGRHQFYAAPSGTSGDVIAWTNLMQFEKDYTVALQGATSTSGTGIAFPPTQNASSNANTLDDYEEGSWTPATNLLGTVTYNAQNGRYTKVGNLVTIIATLICSSTNATQDGTQFQITGLPFAAGGVDCPGPIMITEGAVGTSSSGSHSFGPYLSAGQSVLNVFDASYNVLIAGKSHYSLLTRTIYNGGTLYFQFQMSYRTA